MTTSAKLFLKLVLYSLGGAAISGILGSLLSERELTGANLFSWIAVYCGIIAFITFLAFLASFVVSSNRGPSSELIKPLPESSATRKKTGRSTKQRGKG
ncbi:hypothetical protein [Spirosoma gilvum]